MSSQSAGTPLAAYELEGTLSVTGDNNAPCLPFPSVVGMLGTDPDLLPWVTVFVL